MKPTQLYESRPVYYDNFPDQDRFRDRIYQEEKSLKRTIYLKEKRAKEEAKEKAKQAKASAEALAVAAEIAAKAEENKKDSNT